MAGDLGSTIRVARATVEEFKSTVKHRSADIRKHWLKREDFRKLAAEYPTTDVEFMGQFYREMHQGLVSDPDEFERKYMQIEIALEEWGIEIDDDMRWDDSLVGSLAVRAQDLFRWHNQERSISSCDHDVLMEHYVRRMRGDHVGGLKDVDVWFLTYDRRLTRFAYSTVRDQTVPFTLLAGDWLQIVRQFLPRTSDYNSAFLSLVASPLLADDRALPMRHVVGALERLQRFEGLGERVVAGMIAEQEFVRRFNEVTSPQEEQELVELEVAKVASALDERIAKLEAQLTATESERAAAQERVGTLSRGLDTRDVALTEMSARIDQQTTRIDELAARARRLEAERDAAGQLVSDLGAAATENRLLRWAVFFVVTAFASLAGAVVWRGMTSTPERITLLLAVLAVLVLVAAFLWERASVRKASFWFGVLAFVAALARIVL
jgi:hypothetical protein